MILQRYDNHLVFNLQHIRELTMRGLVTNVSIEKTDGAMLRNQILSDISTNSTIAPLENITLAFTDKEGEVTLVEGADFESMSVVI